MKHGQSESYSHECVGPACAPGKRLCEGSGPSRGCNILIKKDGKTYMGKSIVSVLSACVKCGTEIELVADGNDEAQALQDMVSAVNSGLGE